MTHTYIYICYISVSKKNNVSTNDNMFAMSRNVGPHPLRHVRSMWMRSLGMDRDLGGRWGPGARLCSAGGARLISHGGHGHDPVMDYVSKAIRKNIF